MTSIEENVDMIREQQFWEALDRIFFGGNDPATVGKGIRQLEKEFNWQRSSLGRYLRSIRRAHKRSLAEMAFKAGVDTQTWKSWEHDFDTPTREQLEQAMARLKWSRLQKELAWKLKGEAARFRLKRLTTFQGDYLAAKGVASAANIAWESIDPVSRVRVKAWGEERGFQFPHDLPEFLASFQTEKEKEAWVDEITGVGRA